MRRSHIAVVVFIAVAGLLSGALAAFYGTFSAPEEPAPAKTVAAVIPPPPPVRPATPAAVPPAAAPAALPLVDFQRIAPAGGVSVLAGRSKPGSYVTILADSTVIGSVKADANGEWSLATEHPFPAGEPKVTVREGQTTIAKPAAPPDRPVTVAAKPAEIAPPRNSAMAEQQMLRNLEAAVTAARPQTPPVTAPLSAPDPARPTGVAAAPAAAAETAGARREPLSGYPVPITFVYREASPTSSGEKAAELLLEYVRLKGLTALKLTGHADERGTDEFNMELSRQRLDVVAARLRAGGYKGELELVPRGRAEPFQGVDRRRLPVEDLYQLDRRVELSTVR
ncbi:MAG: OmpA family protein [Hyphomicrobiaceae bacterium]